MENFLYLSSSAVYILEHVEVLIVRVMGEKKKRVMTYPPFSPILSCFLVHPGGEEVMGGEGVIEDSLLSECLRTSCIFFRTDFSQHTPFLCTLYTVIASSVFCHWICLP